MIRRPPRSTLNVYRRQRQMCIRDRFKPDTESEVFEMLKKEAEKRGFVECVCFYGASGAKMNTPIEIGKEYNIEMNDVGLYCDDSYILFKGKWATIVEAPKEMTLEEIEKQLGHKVKITTK